LGLFLTQKERWCCMTWDMVARLWWTVFHDLPGTESTRDCSYRNPPRWSRGTPSLLPLHTSSSNTCGL
jgi:hypothetical protein